MPLSFFGIVVVGHDAPVPVRCGKWRPVVSAIGRCAYHATLRPRVEGPQSKVEDRHQAASVHSRGALLFRGRNAHFGRRA
jgi:hypothetical protein